ncbi:MAG: hypothetical protein ABI263_00050 [Gelidibacter sp.]
MKKTLFLTGIVFLMFSCNSGSKESSETTADGKTKKVSNKDNSKSYDCLKKFEDDYSLLLTKEEMTSVYPINSDKIKTQLRSGSYGEHMYQWPSDRPTFFMEISGMKMELPDQNTMGVKNLSFYSDKSEMKSTIATFNMAYKELSQEELDRIQESLAKQKDEVKQTGEDLMKVRAKRSWVFVDGLGSSAWYKWNEQWGGELVVLAGKANFSIITKISNDPEENRELAKKLAEKVIAKCK